MSEFPHDDFAKAYLSELLRVIGTVQPNFSLKGETRIADLWFEAKTVLLEERFWPLGGSTHERCLD